MTVDNAVAVASPATVRSYAPSWIDRLTAAIAKRPLKGAPVYLAAWLGLFGSITVGTWVAGGYPVGRFDLLHALFATGTVAALVLVQLFNAMAASATRSLAPILAPAAPPREELEYRMTRTPSLLVLALCTWDALAIAALAVLSPATFTALRFGRSSLSVVIGWATLTTFAVFASAYGAKILWTTFEVYRVSARYVEVRLTRVSALYGLSTLTAWMAATMAIATSVVVAVSPIGLDAPLAAGNVVGALVVTVLVLTLPLSEIHERLVAAKGLAIEDCSSRMAAVSAELHAAVDARDLAAMDPLNKAMVALDTERRALDAVPTWPWRPDTLRWIVGALMFPIALFVLQYLIGRVLRP